MWDDRRPLPAPRARSDTRALRVDSSRPPCQSRAKNSAPAGRAAPGPAAARAGRLHGPRPDQTALRWEGTNRYRVQVVPGEIEMVPGEIDCTRAETAASQAVVRSICRIISNIYYTSQAVLREAWL